jgi:hypothetical protein
LFRFYTETESFDVSIEPKQTEDQPNSLIESIFWYFYENLGLFRFVSVCLETVLFILIVSIKVDTPKQTEIFCFWFHETNRNKTDLVSVCFGSNQIFCSLFRGHPTQGGDFEDSKEENS